MSFNTLTWVSLTLGFAWMMIHGYCVWYILQDIIRHLRFYASVCFWAYLILGCVSIKNQLRGTKPRGTELVLVQLDQGPKRQTSWLMLFWPTLPVAGVITVLTSIKAVFHLEELRPESRVQSWDNWRDGYVVIVGERRNEHKATTRWIILFNFSPPSFPSCGGGERRRGVKTNDAIVRSNVWHVSICWAFNVPTATWRIKPPSEWYYISISVLVLSFVF